MASIRRDKNRATVTPKLRPIKIISIFLAKFDAANLSTACHSNLSMQMLPHVRSASSTGAPVQTGMEKNLEISARYDLWRRAPPSEATTAVTGRARSDVFKFVELTPRIS